jgi:hypothetical protein
MKILSLLLLGGLAVAGFAQGDPWAQKVTFSSPGEGLPSFAKRLGAQTGTSIEATAALADTPVVVRVREIPLGTLLERVAKVTGTVLRKDGETLRFTRPQETLMEHARRDRARKGEALTALIGRYRAEMGQQPEMTPDLAKVMAGNGNANPGQMPWTPARRALIEALGRVDPLVLAAIEPGKRQIFSTAPNRMQKGLSGTMPILKGLLKSQAAYVQAVRERAGSRRIGTTEVSVAFAGSPTHMANGNFDAGVGKALLKVQCAANFVFAELIVVDPAGQLLMQASEYLVQNSAPAAGAAEPALRLSELAREFIGLRGAPGTRVLSLELTEGNVEIAALSIAGAEPSASRPASESLRKAMAQPTKTDPVALGAGEALQDMAEQGDQQLVAFLPDRAVTSLNQGLAQSLGATPFWSALNAHPDLNVLAKEGWIEVEPRYLAEAVRQQIDRAALEKLVKALRAKQAIRLDDVAAYAVETKKPMSLGDLDTIILGHVEPKVSSADVDDYVFQSWDMVRLWGHASARLRQSLLGGQPIALGALSGPVLDIVEDAVYQPTNGQILMFSGTAIVTVDRARPAPGPLANEPTEVLPNGLPRDGTLTGRARIEPAVRAWSPRKPPTTLNAVAYSTSTRTEGAGGFETFQPAEILDLRLSINAPPLRPISRSLRDAGVVAGSRAGRYQDLPAEFRRRVQEIERRNQGGTPASPGAPPPQ